jgi:DNA-binding transcriptional LysR family regulator
MTNVPTDLLRTLVAVVDLRSFTKAAASLGVTQPAVSAQIKRLQLLIGAELLDRSAPGVSLTSQGEFVVGYARRLLSLNDQIVNLGPQPELVIRIGTPSDYVISVLIGTLARLRNEWPDVRFIARTGLFEPLMRDLRAGDLDMFIALSNTPAHDARHSSAEPVVWVRGATTRLESDRPVPLVSHGEPCPYRRVMVSMLKSAGLHWEDVFTGPSTSSVEGAVKAGLGVTAMARRRAIETKMIVWDDAPLPKLPELYSGIYIREGGATAAYEHLADQLVTSLHTLPDAANVNTPRKTSSIA